MVEYTSCLHCLQLIDLVNVGLPLGLYCLLLPLTYADVCVEEKKGYVYL